MIHVCDPLFSTVKSVVMDSGPCVANGIVAHSMKGLYSGALVKKHQYWPKCVLGSSTGIFITRR